jgi:hypothetical protein
MFKKEMEIFHIAITNVVIPWTIMPTGFGAKMNQMP